MIIWKGNTPFEDYVEYKKVPKDAKLINIPDKVSNRAILFAIPFFIICFAALFIKEKSSYSFELDRIYKIAVLN